MKAAARSTAFPLFAQAHKRARMSTPPVSPLLSPQQSASLRERSMRAPLRRQRNAPYNWPNDQTTANNSPGESRGLPGSSNALSQTRQSNSKSQTRTCTIELRCLGLSALFQAGRRRSALLLLFPRESAGQAGAIVVLRAKFKAGKQRGGCRRLRRRCCRCKWKKKAGCHQRRPHLVR